MVGWALAALALSVCLHECAAVFLQREDLLLRREEKIPLWHHARDEDADHDDDASGEENAAFDPLSALRKAATKGADAASKAPLVLPLAGGVLMTSSALTGASFAAAPSRPVLPNPMAGAAQAVQASMAAGAQAVQASVAAGAAAFGLKRVVEDTSDPDVGVEMEELVLRRGYPIERHRIVTEDGYVLGTYRIPHGRFKEDRPEKTAHGRRRRPVVLLQHGLQDSSLAFVANFHDQSLAFILADAGYDVWMGNNRGNRYSRAHMTLSPRSSRYWNFTWVEMAEYDLPAEVDYILRHTGAQRFAYVGHSEGSTQAFAAFSSNSKLASKVSVFVAMAPVCFVGSQRVMFLKAVQSLGLDRMMQMLGDEVFYLNNQASNAIMPNSCRALSSGCAFLMEAFAGKSDNLNQTRIHVYATMFPAGTSTMNIRHWVQSIKTKSFGKFDYGSSKANMRHYGSASPPTFNLKDFTVPTAIFSGANDQMADPEDVRHLMEELNSRAVFRFKEVPSYAHLDFILAMDAKTKLYPHVLSALAEYMS